MFEVQVECPVCEDTFWESTTHACSGVLDTCCNGCGSDLSVDYHIEAYADSITVVEKRRHDLENEEE